MSTGSQHGATVPVPANKEAFPCKIYVGSSQGKIQLALERKEADAMGFGAGMVTFIETGEETPTHFVAKITISTQASTAGARRRGQVRIRKNTSSNYRQLDISPKHLFGQYLSKKYTGGSPLMQLLQFDRASGVIYLPLPKSMFTTRKSDAVSGYKKKAEESRRRHAMKRQMPSAGAATRKITPKDVGVVGVYEALKVSLDNLNVAIKDGTLAVSIGEGGILKGRVTQTVTL